MRWIFLTLVLANGALGGWYYWQSQNPVQKEVLVSSVELGNLELISKEELAEEVEQKPENIAFVCQQLGPLKSELNADQVLTRMASLDIEGSKFTEQQEIVKDYWVYLPPFDSYAEAKAKLTELNKKGFESFLFTSGELKNGISLGLYGNRNNAVRLVEQLKQSGYDVSIKPNRRLQDVWWVRLDRQGTEYFNDGILENLRARYPDITSKEAPC